MQTLTFPVTHEKLRRAVALKDICPECGNELDTGWECNNQDCRYDARADALAATNADLLALLVWQGADEPPAIVKRH